MRVWHTIDDGPCPPVDMVFQHLRMTCPKCHQPVEYVVCQDDKLYKEENEYLREKHIRMLDEIKRLTKILDLVLEKSK